MNSLSNWAKKVISVGFFTYLGIFWFIKVINEISSNSIENMFNFNEFLLLVVVTGLFTSLTKSDEDFLNQFRDYSLKFIKKRVIFIIAIVVSVCIAFLVYQKMKYWTGGGIVSTLSGFLFFVLVFQIYLEDVNKTRTSTIRKLRKFEK